MDKNLDKIAEELFNKIRSQISNVQLADEDTQVTDEPELARYFSFDYEPSGIPLGSVTITINEDDGLVIMYSNDLLSHQPESVHKKWYKFLQELREFAKRRFLNFEARDILKSLDKKDFDSLSKNSKKGDDQMAESKLWGTSKTSYQNIGEAKMVVRHHTPINVDAPRSRSQHIESIYIESANGERFKYPVKHLNGARAMARHVSNGGNVYDSIGTHISGLSEELANLKMFKGYVDRNPVISESMNDIQTKVSERIGNIKKQFQQLQTQHHYTEFAENFEQDEKTEIPESIMNDWIDRLTVKSFNEELKKVFPYIYKLVDAPIKELSSKDFVASTDSMVEEEQSVDIIESELESYKKYLDSLVEEAPYDVFSGDDSIIDKLNQLMADHIPVGADGTNAIESMNGIIHDQNLNDVFKELADISPESDARGIIYDYIKIKDEENNTNVISKIKFEDGDQESPQPAPEVPPVPEQPAQPEQKTIADSINRAIKAGAQLDSKLTEKVTVKDAILKAGLKVEDFFNENDKVLEYVKSMYDYTTGKFPKGETGVILAVEKQFGKPATKFAAESIKQLRTVFETSRMKKLAGI